MYWVGIPALTSIYVSDMIRYFISLLVSLLMAIFLFGDVAYPQAVPDTVRTAEDDLERILEDFDPDDEDINPEELVQFLTDLLNNPININSASLDELAPIPGLNPRLAQSIINYRRTKPFESIDELTEVAGIGQSTLERMRPYITIGPRAALTRQLLLSPGYWVEGGRLEVFSRMQTVLEEQVGYTPPETEGQSRYAGSQIRYYQRFNYRSRRLSLNLTQNKRPGEPLGGPLDFDFQSWHIGVQDVGLLRRLVIGDYGIWAGQGLVLWTGLAFGKGREVIRAPSRSERGLQPYQSTEETRFMRGVAATVGGDLQVTGFYSRRPLSATVVQGDSIRFPSSTGFHRTQTERDRRFNTELEMYGGRVRYNSAIGIIGATGYYAEYNRYIVPGTALHNKHDFEGTVASAFGVDYRLFLGPVTVFGEGARSRNGGLGLVSGLEYPIDPNTSLVAVYRNYGKDFQSLYGAGFGEVSGLPRNEEGLYIGFAHRFNDIIRFSGYFDQFRFPAPRFGTRQATSGYDWLGAVDLRFSRALQGTFIARSKIRENDYRITDTFGREINVMGQDARTSLRAQLDYQVTPSIRTRTRFEWVRARDRDDEPEFGNLIFQDIRWTPNSRLTLDMRLTLFQTDSFTSRVFAFENDMLYVFSVAAFSGIGQRGYILLRYNVTNNIDVWMKYAVTVFEDRQSVGSGLDESFGNSRSQLGAQVRIRF